LATAFLRDRVEAAVSQLERRIKKSYPEVQRVFRGAG